MKHKGIKQSVVGWTGKSDIEFFGKVFMGFKERPTLATTKRGPYKKKVRITLEVL